MIAGVQSSERFGFGSWPFRECRQRVNATFVMGHLNKLFGLRVVEGERIGFRDTPLTGVPEISKGLDLEIIN